MRVPSTQGRSWKEQRGRTGGQSSEHISAKRQLAPTVNMLVEERYHRMMPRRCSNLPCTSTPVIRLTDTTRMRVFMSERAWIDVLSMSE